MKHCPGVIYGIEFFQFGRFCCVFRHINAVGIFHSEYKNGVFTVKMRGFVEPVKRLVRIFFAVQAHFVNHADGIIRIDDAVCSRANQEFKAFLFIPFYPNAIKIHQSKNVLGIAVTMCSRIFQPVQAFFKFVIVREQRTDFVLH